MRTCRFELIEISVTQALVGKLNTLNFGQQPLLQSISGDKQVFIKSIAAYTADMLTLSPITPGNTVVLAADIPNLVLNLDLAGKFQLHRLPFVELIKFQGTTSPSQFWPYEVHDLWEVDWTKSEIQFLNAPASVIPFSVVLGVTYDYTPDNY